MKARIVAEVARITGDRLTPAMCDELADCVVKIVQSEALAAMEAVRETIVNGDLPEKPKA